MIQLRLSDDQRQELQRRLRQHGLSPVPALRLEIIRLAADVGCHEQTARKFVKAFRTDGFAGLEDRPRPGPHRRLLDTHLQALDRLLDQTDRTWTAPQLAVWLEREQGVRVHPDYLRRVLHRRRFAYKRTKRDVAHKRKDPALHDAKAADLEVLAKPPVPAS
jgi:transposase